MARKKTLERRKKILRCFFTSGVVNFINE